MKNVFSRWIPETFTVAGQALKLKVKALSPLEGPPFMAQMTRFGKATEGTGDVNTKLEALFGTLYPDFARECFEKYVRPDEAIETDEGPATTGAQVFDLVANQSLVMDVLLKIQALTMADATEGKGSGSPSTSGSDGTPGSSSGVKTIGPGGGPSHSTATVTHIGRA